MVRSGAFGLFLFFRSQSECSIALLERFVFCLHGLQPYTIASRAPLENTRSEFLNSVVPQCATGVPQGKLEYRWAF